MVSPLPHRVLPTPAGRKGFPHRLAPKVLSLVGILASLGLAAVTGKVVGIKGSPYFGGDLVLVDLPSQKEKILVAGKCMGPSFSPDGSRIAFSLSGKVHLIDAAGGTPVPTAIVVPPAPAGGNAEGGAPLYWLKVDGKDYIYWSPFDKSLYRQEIGGDKREAVFTNSNGGAIFWAGVSRDGKKAAFTDNWRVKSVDFATGALIDFGAVNGGCNSSLSPDGSLVTHLLNKGKSWERHGLAWVQHNREGGLGDEPANIHKALTLPNGCVDFIRFSHSSNFHVLLQEGCKGGAGHLLDLRDDSRTALGNIVGYDFFAGEAQAQAAAVPSISPPGGGFTEDTVTVSLTSATPGADIRYTLDGSAPGPASPAGTAFKLKLGRGQSVTVKAIALKAGLQPSLVASGVFTGASLRAAAPSAGTMPGLAFRRYAGPFTGFPDLARLAPAESGQVDSIGPGPGAGPYALRLEGWVQVDAPGLYLFAVDAGGPFRLTVGDTVLVKADAAMTAASGRLGLEAGKHALRLEYVQTAGSGLLRAALQGPKDAAPRPLGAGRLWRLASTAPLYTITAPKAGDMAPIGQVLRLRWTANPDLAGDCVFDLSVDGGRSWQTVTTTSIMRGTPAYGDYSWTVPEILGGVKLAGKTGILRLSTYNNPGEEVRSPPFTLGGSVGILPFSRDGGGSRRGSAWIAVPGGLALGAESGPLLLKASDAAGRLLEGRLVPGKTFALPPGLWWLEGRSPADPGRKIQGRVFVFGS